MLVVRGCAQAFRHFSSLMEGTSRKDADRRLVFAHENCNFRYPEFDFGFRFIRAINIINFLAIIYMA